MAITIPSVSLGFSNTTGADLAVTFPTGSMQTGDWIYLFGGHFRRAGISIGPNPIGSWEQLYSENAGGSTNGCGLWRKQWDGSETQVTCFGSGNSVDGVAYGRIIVRNSDICGTVVAAAAAGVANAPAATGVTSTEGSAVFIFAQAATSDTSPGTVANYTTVNANANATTNDMSLSFGYDLTPTADDNPAAWSSWTSANYRALTLIIKMAVRVADLEVGAPVLDEPVLASVSPVDDIPAAVDLTTAPPSIDTANITEIINHVLTADDLAASGPTFTTKTLVSGLLDLVLYDYVRDNGLGALATADQMLLCGITQPATYAAAQATKLASAALGVGNVFGAPAAAADGRQATSVAITGGTVDIVDGEAICWAAVDTSNSRLLASGLIDTTDLIANSSWSMDPVIVHMPRG